MTRKRRKYPNVSPFVDRHGKERWRWRKVGHNTYYFRNPPGTPGFAEELAACQAGSPIRVGGDRAIPGSVGDLIARYYGSADFNGGGADDQRRRRLILESFRAELGDDLIEDFRFEHIEAILIKRSHKQVNDKGREVGGPVAAVNLRKQLRRLFAYARRLGWIASNPVEDAGRVGATRIDGYHTWTDAEITQYRLHHAMGTKARLALEIMLWTSQRRGDARLFGPKHIIGGKIRYSPSKTGRELSLPIAPQLQAAIDAMPAIGISTFLVTEFGKPFSRAGFGNKMREWCNEAGLPHCTAHGLRKAAARRMAEAGVTQQGIKSVGGWRGDAEVTTYTEAADQEMLAEAAIRRVIDRDLANREAGLAKSGGQAHEK